MARRTTRIVYMTDSVIIDYNATLELFVTQQERLPLTAGKILHMLNYRACQARVMWTGVRMRVFVGEKHCILTQRAIARLTGLYRCSRELQIEFPYLLPFFASDPQEVRH